MTATEAVSRLAKNGIQCGGSHFYSVRLLEAMGFSAEDGVVRFSFVHYTDEADIQRSISALEETG